MLRYLSLALLLSFSQLAIAQDDEAPSQSPVEQIELPADLDRVLRDYEDGWRNRDAESLAGLFSEDGFIMRPGHAPIRGRANIAEAYSNSGGPLHLHAFSYSTSDSVGYIIGGYRGAPDQVDAGKFILTLEKNSHGIWEITADMDNSNHR